MDGPSCDSINLLHGIVLNGELRLPDRTEVKKGSGHNLSEIAITLRTIPDEPADGGGKVGPYGKNDPPGYAAMPLTPEEIERRSVGPRR